MSAELTLVEAPASNDVGDELWHRATREETARAVLGYPFTTLCGQVRPELRRSRQHGVTPDLCVVCQDIEARGGRS